MKLIVPMVRHENAPDKRFWVFLDRLDAGGFWMGDFDRLNIREILMEKGCYYEAY